MHVCVAKPSEKWPMDWAGYLWLHNSAVTVLDMSGSSKEDLTTACYPFCRHFTSRNIVIRLSIALQYSTCSTVMHKSVLRNFTLFWELLICFSCVLKSGYFCHKQINLFFVGAHVDWGQLRDCSSCDWSSQVWWGCWHKSCGLIA